MDNLAIYSNEEGAMFRRLLNTARSNLFTVNRILFSSYQKFPSFITHCSLSSGKLGFIAGVLTTIYMCSKLYNIVQEHNAHDEYHFKKHILYHLDTLKPKERIKLLLKLDPEELHQRFLDGYRLRDALKKLKTPEEYCHVLDHLGKQYVNKTLKGHGLYLMSDIPTSWRLALCKYLNEHTSLNIIDEKLDTLSLTDFPEEHRLDYLMLIQSKSTKEFDHISHHDAIKAFLEDIPLNDHRKFLCECIGIDRLINAMQQSRCYIRLIDEIISKITLEDRSNFIKKLNETNIVNCLNKLTYLRQRQTHSVGLGQLLESLKSEDQQLLLNTIPNSWIDDNFKVLDDLISAVKHNNTWDKSKTLFERLGKKKVETLLNNSSSGIEELSQHFNSYGDRIKLKEFLYPNISCCCFFNTSTKPVSLSSRPMNSVISLSKK